MAARRRLLVAALALLWFAAAALPGRPAAVMATNPWLLTLSPTSLTLGVPTDITITVTDGSELIGCFVVDVPAGFAVLGASVSSVPAGSVWSAAVVGSGPTVVTFNTTRDPWRLNSHAVGVFVIRVVATAGPLPAWTASAYKKFSVSSTQLNGGPQVPPVPFAIGSAPTPTPPASQTARPTTTTIPAATPTPARTSAPGATPAATPTARPTGATPPPGAGATAAEGSAGAPIGSPDPSGSATASIGPEVAGVAAPGPGGAASPARAGNPGGAAAGDETTLDIAALPEGGTVRLDNQSAGGIGMFAWIVPGLFLSLPGLLLILIVMVQAALATGFVPITRRVLGVGRRRRHHGRVSSS